MFDGGAEQFQQLIAPQRTTTLPLHHLPFPLSSNPNNTFLPFDPYNNPTSSQLQTKDEVHKEVAPIINTETELPDQNLIVDSWTNDEVLALLRIRSSMENWFPELTWEHVSRKLGEIGFKKSAEKCKEKFEDESRYFDNLKNYRFLSELEELCQPDHHPNTQVEIENENPTKSSKMKKRKKRERLEMFKGFCESIVNKMMAQQEETHKKLIQDMLKRDEEKIVREEEWKKKEMDKMNKELEIMAQELVIAGNRHASILQFLNKYAFQDNAKRKTISEQNPNNSPNDNVTPNHHQMATENPSSSETPVQVPSSSNSSPTPNNLSISEKENVVRRWPRDEVLALINLRCNAGKEKEANNNNKVPLWERISQGMLELGYKRSAKRCKEKWENINKYFRKTKDVNKKRSFDSRTCPYFHQLSYLYSQGKLAPPAEFNPIPIVGEAQAQAQAQAQPKSSQVESLVV